MTGKVATCKRPPRPDGPPPGKNDLPPPPDDSLLWSADVAADGSRTVNVQIWNGSGYDAVIADRVGAGS